MVFLEPEDSLKLDIPEIDSQHNTLINLVNQLHEYMLKGIDKATLGEHLSKVLKHTQAHFTYEEELMSRYNYPGYEKHKSEHDRLIQQLVNLITRFKNGDLLLSFAVELELKGWTVVHIEKSDKPLGSYLHNQKVTEATPG